MTATLMGTTWLVAKRHGYRPDLAERPGFGEVAAATAIPAIC